MLPGRVGQRLLLGENPLIGRLFTAGGTKPAFATEADFLGMRTLWIGAGMFGVSHDFQSAREHARDILYYRWADDVGMLSVIIPPCLACLKQFFDRADGTYD